MPRSLVHPLLHRCTAAPLHRQARAGAGADWYGTHDPVADCLGGRCRLLDDEALVGDERGTSTAGRIVDGPDGAPIFLAWRRLDDAGAFLGGLSNPAPVRVPTDGRLAVETAALWPH